MQVVPFAQSWSFEHQTLHTPSAAVPVAAKQRASCVFGMPHPGSGAAIELTQGAPKLRRAVQVGVFISYRGRHCISLPARTEMQSKPSGQTVGSAEQSIPQDRSNRPCGLTYPMHRSSGPPHWLSLLHGAQRPRALIDPQKLGLGPPLTQTSGAVQSASTTHSTH